MIALPEMPCQEIVEAIAAYLDGALPEPDRTRFEEHLATCDPCTRYLAQLRETIEVLGRLDEEAILQSDREALLTLFRDWLSPMP